MKIKLPLLVFLAFLMNINIYGQKIFREGYIIKKTGETLNGLIEYTVNQKKTDKCIFKRFDIAREVVYLSKDIKSFGYRNGNRYESLEYKGKTSFFEVMVTGKIILYTNGSGFYINKDHQGLIELEKGALSYNDKDFRDLPEFLTYITEGKRGNIDDKFNLKSDLLPLITFYNKESGNDYFVFNRALSKKQLSTEVSLSGAGRNKFGLLSGLNIYDLNLGNSPTNGYNSIYFPSPEKETDLISGLTYERLLLRKRDKLSFRIDIMYTAQTFYCYNESHESIWIIRDDAFFDFAAVKVPLLLQYSFTGRRIVPYINAGLAYQYLISGNYSHVKETEQTFSREVTTDTDNNFTFKSGEISGIGGLGIRTRVFSNINLHLQTRIEYGSGLFVNFNPDIPNEDPYIQNSFQYSLLIGITF